MATANPETFAWFHQFDSFTHDPTAGLRNNFNRLASHRNWVARERVEQWRECRRAVLGTIDNIEDISTLEKWQRLCQEVGLDPDLPSITACKKALKNGSVMVNLVNLMDHRTIGTPLIHFNDYNHFLNHTRKKRNQFPRELAKENGFIRALLRML